MPSPDIYFYNLPVLAPGQSIQITSFIRIGYGDFSSSDLLAINIRNNTEQGGYFELNGQRLPEGTGSGSTIDFFRYSSYITGPNDFLFSDMNNLRFVAASSDFVDELVVNGAIQGYGNIGSDTASIQTDAPSPEVTVAYASATSMSEGGAITYTVQLSSPAATDVRVYYSLTGSGSNPIEANDVTTSGSYFYIPAGQTQGNLTVFAAQDGVYDGGQEQYTITLTSVTGDAVLGSATQFIGRIDDGQSLQPGTLSINSVSTSLNEGDIGSVTFQFQVTRSGGTDGSVGADWRIVPVSSGVNATDFVTSMSGSSVWFSSGQTTQTISVQVRGDIDVEADELFSVVLENPTGGASLGMATATATIRNDDAVVVQPGVLSVAANSVSVVEGDTGDDNQITFQITRSGGTDGAVSVEWGIVFAGFDATSDDFVPATQYGIETFAAGQTIKTITVAVAGDLLVESNESFGVRIFNPTGGATIGTDLATATIEDDDASMVLFPVNGGNTTGYNISAGYQFASGHMAVDVNANTGGNSDRGDAVTAIADGRVTLVDENRPGGYGGVVMMEHVINGETYTALYSHLIEIPAAVLSAFQNGTTLAAGTLLGGMGNGTESDQQRYNDNGDPILFAYDFDGDGVDSYYSWQYAHLHFSITDGTHYVPQGDWNSAVPGAATPEGVQTFVLGSGANSITFYNPWQFIASPPAGGPPPTEPGGNSQPLFTANSDIVTWTGAGVAYAQGGNDSVMDSGLGDTMYGQAGNDTLDGGAGRDMLFGGDGDDSLLGGGNHDILYGGLGLDALFGSSGNDSIFGGDNNDTLDAGTGDDMTAGDAGDDHVFAGAGTDTLSGGEGNDLLVGGGGNDLFDGGSGADTLSGGAGRDMVDYSEQSANLRIDLATKTGLGGDASGDVLLSIEDVTGGSGNDVLLGDSGSNLLIGGAGRDNLHGGAGGVRDVLIGGAQSDVLNGGLGHDIMNGNGGNDTVIGGGGNDTLLGGNSNDTLSGGAGADLFVFQTGWDADVITDWETGIDRARVVSGYSQSDVTLSQQGTDVLFTLTPTGDTIRFQNTLLADVDLAGDFVFV